MDDRLAQGSNGQIVIVLLIWIISAGFLLPLYTSLIRSFRAAGVTRRRIVVAFAAVHLLTWTAGHITESRRHHEQTWRDFRQAVEDDRKKVNQAEAVLRNPRTTSQEKGFAEVALKMMPGHLNESPAMMHVCTSPFPFLFICYEGRSFGPLYGWGNGYIGVYTGRRMIKLYDQEIWVS